MFVRDIRSEFYNVILDKHQQRVLVLVALDVDAVCACKIIQFLFHCDNIQYTLIPITGKKGLQKAYEDYRKQIKHVLLINCGATFDVVEFFQPDDDDVIFFIADCHRPIDVYNIYRDDQVRLLMKDEDNPGIPSYEELFRDDESDEEEDSDQLRRFDEAALERQREKRLWLENRKKIIFDYTQFSYFGQSTALVIYDLAWKMSKENNDILWWAIVGMTEQFIFAKSESEKYVLEAGNLQGHLSRLSHHSADDGNSISVMSMKISFDKELQLNLYHHWSIFESIQHTMHMACHFKLWTIRGQKKLHGFLADIGLPLVQCKQKFRGMDLEFKNNIRDLMESMTEKYNLQHIIYGSFQASYGYRNKFSAADVVFAVSAILESVDRNRTCTDKFLGALHALSRKNAKILNDGIEEAKLQLSAVYRQVQSFLDTHLVISAGPFLYAVVEEGMDAKYFSYPGCLAMLANFLLRAHVAVSKNRRVKNLPLVMMTPNIGNAETSLVIGVPPISEDSPRNFFGKAFETAGEKSRTSVNYDFFDTSVIEIKTDDRSRFFDSLISILS